MRKFATAWAVSAAIGLGVLTAPQAANAQATITLGGNDRQLGEMLSSRGYTDLVVTKRGFTITTLEGCRNGEKFKLKVNILGKITSNKKIGSCGSRFSRRDAEAAMQKAGYTDIQSRQNGPQVVATGCRENRSYELTFNLRGDLINRDRRGRCAAQALNTREVRSILRDQGYNRIKFTDKELPRYVAQACNGNNRVELRINGRGKINRERRTGTCRGAVNPDNLAAILRQQGYTRVEAIQTNRAPYMVRGCKGEERQEIIVSRFGEALSNTKLGTCRTEVAPNQLSAFVENLGYERVNVLRGNRTPYLVEACKSGALLELAIGRFGRIQKEERVGRCAAPLNEQQAREKLAEAGYYLPTLQRRDNGSWNVEACKGDTKVSMRINRRGEIRRENAIGSCRSETTRNILSTLQERGASQMRLYVEGCFKNRTYRWQFDQLGNRTGRERLGGSC